MRPNPNQAGNNKQKSGEGFMQDSFTRRGLLATAGALALTAPVRAADKEPVFDDSQPTRGVAIPSVQHMDEMAAAPLIQKKVNKLWNDSPTIKEPNALQFTAKGTLLILDQVDPNKVFEVNPSDGKILRTVQTESIHGSGITVDAGGNWIITSTKALQGPPVTLKVDPQSGKTLQKWAGNGRYWMAVPASGRIFLMDEASGKAVRSLVAPVNRTHGLAIDGNFLWSVGSDFSQIHKLDSKTGKIVAKIQLDKKNDPAIHGLEIKDGVLWYCDAASGWVCNLT
jgi:hypothetical protein